jgi:2-methylcitrate dehydratase PrpD
MGTRVATTASLLDAILTDGKSLPTSSIEAARVLTLDFLGVAIAGANTVEGRTIADVTSAAEPSGACGVPVVPYAFSPASAALVTGTMGYSIGLTDTHSRSITHPGPSVIPAALAVGQAVGATGADVLRAVVLGVEIVARVGAAVNPSHRQRGFHPTATCNPFGAALAASVLLGSDVDQTMSALGIAGSMSGGLYEFRQSGSMLMALHGGWPAHGGVIAAYLAHGGFTGPPTVLEGPEGFLRSFADEVHPEELIRPEGSAWLVEDLSLRPYSACRYAHAGIDALREIGVERTVRPEEISRLTVWTHRTAVEQETEPTTLVSARLCTRFSIAMAVVHGPQLTDVSESDLQDTDVRGLLDRIDVREDPALTAMFPVAWPCRVEIEFTDGTTISRQVDVPKGDPANPMTPAEIEEKFRHLVAPTVGRDGADRLIEQFARFDRMPVEEMWPLTKRAGGQTDGSSGVGGSTV